jgi:hypothetical protein
MVASKEETQLEREKFLHSVQQLELKLASDP